MDHEAHQPGGHPSYHIVTAAGSGEITEKKSRFLADVFPIKSAEDAEARIQEIRKRYWDARHHCYAFAVGPRRENTRCSDDGEPSGTAGKPILEVLTGADLTDTLIVVTRYFGGTLLGTGGLVRAYTQAAQAGIAAAPRAEMVYGRKITIDIEYHHVGALQRYLAKNNLIADDIKYEQNVRFELHIISDDIDKFCDAVTQLADGRARIQRGAEGFFARGTPAGARGDA